MLRSPRRSSDLRLFNFGWRHKIDHQGLVNLWWRAKRRSALLVPERTNSGTKPKNLSWVCGVRCQSLLPPTRDPMGSRFAIAISRRSKRSAEHRPACACGYGSNGDGLYHMVKSHGFTTPFHRDSNRASWLYRSYDGRFPRLPHSDAHTQFARSDTQRKGSTLHAYRATHTEFVELEGIIRSVDLDAQTFPLSERPDHKPDLPCEYGPELEDAVKESLDCRVMAAGGLRDQPEERQIQTAG